jgi:CheY-like chemotaxis protein
VTAGKLFWSKRGEVACGAHAPHATGPRWRQDGWQELYAPGRRVRYQCQFCQQTPVARPNRDQPGAAPLVLNVDDRPATLYARDRTLRQHGFAVANAETGQAALEAARELRPQLILLDVFLPDTDGRELCRRFKADSELSHIPVVLISAGLAAGDADAGVRQARADGVLVEPVPAEALVSTLRKVLYT